MDGKWVAAIAGMLTGLIGSAFAEDGSRLQLASLSPPPGYEALEQRLEGMSVRLLEPASLAPGTDAQPSAGLEAPAPSVRDKRPRPHTAAPPREKSRPRVVEDGLGASYSNYFSPPAEPTGPGREAPASLHDAEPLLWTVLNGPGAPAAGVAAPRAPELDPPAELLVAVRAGF